MPLDPQLSETRLAPQGKNCTRCLCCPALISFEGELLCAACDDGTHPPLPEQRRTLPGSEIHGGNLPIALKTERATAVPQPNAEKTMTKTVLQSKRGNINKRISEKVRQAICKEIPTISHRDLAAKYAISDVSVYYIRKAAGIRVQKQVIPAKTAAQPSHSEGSMPSAGLTVRGLDPPATKPTVHVDFNVSEKYLDSWWASLSLEQKGRVFGGHFQITIEGWVS